MTEQSHSMRRIFYLVCALIAMASLYPFDFGARRNGLDLFETFSRSVHVPLERGLIRDILANLIAYMPVGFFFVLDARGRRTWVRIARGTLAGLALSTTMECLQYLVPIRTPSLLDIATNTISAGVGSVAAVLFATRVRRLLETFEEALGHPSSALFLTLVWLMAMFCPGDWGRLGILSRLHTMSQGSIWHPLQLFIATAHWIGIGALVRTLVTREMARKTFVLAGLATLGRVLVPGQGLLLTDFAATALAVALWSIPEIERRLTPRVVAALLCMALLADELRPWHFAPVMGHFNWMPFGSMLSGADWSSGLMVLMRKSAIYGTALWSLMRMGWSAKRSTIVVAVILGVGEVTQTMLPLRTPETTEVALAVILGAILYRLERRFGVRRAPKIEPATHVAMPTHTPRPGAAQASRPGDGKPWTGGRRSEF